MFIRNLIERVTSGDIRIPAFQRGYVWEPDQVAFLLDSIYKEFPIGTIILWQTDERLNTEKNLGSFQLPEPKRDYPVNYVLDGQQRITSLFSTFQSDLTPIDHEWMDIYFDMDAEENIQESVFLALSQDEVDGIRHFPVKTLFDTVAYRRASENLSEDKIKKIDILQQKFREYNLQTQTFESQDRNAVAIVFERINRAGTELKVFELLSAWSWSDDFDLVERFKDLQDEISEHGFADLCDEQDLQLRICAGVITGETTPAKIMDLQGDEIRNRFVEIRNGIIGALDFLSREAGVKHFKMMPFPSALVALSCFFATPRGDGVNYTEKQKRTLLAWFWRTNFSRRYSSDVNERQAVDIRELLALKGNEDYATKLPQAELKIDFERNTFLSSSANSKSLILMLCSKNPYSLISGAAIDVSRVLKKGSRHEFHHIFPQKILRDSGRDKREINALANICFLTRGDNNDIRASLPSDYVERISKDRVDDYLERSLIPSSISDNNYEDFLRERSALLEQQSYILMDVSL